MRRPGAEGRWRLTGAGMLNSLPGPAPHFLARAGRGLSGRTFLCRPCVLPQLLHPVPGKTCTLLLCPGFSEASRATAPDMPALLAQTCWKCENGGRLRGLLGCYHFLHEARTPNHNSPTPDSLWAPIAPLGLRRSGESAGRGRPGAGSLL